MRARHWWLVYAFVMFCLCVGFSVRAWNIQPLPVRKPDMLQLICRLHCTSDDVLTRHDWSGAWCECPDGARFKVRLEIERDVDQQERP